MLFVTGKHAENALEHMDAAKTIVRQDLYTNTVRRCHYTHWVLFRIKLHPGMYGDSSEELKSK